MIKISIFTATYNRRKLLYNCYQSLLKQTSKEFIWLIVDDGSTDDTYEYVQKWQKDNRINIVYIKQENQGKHVAHNTAVVNCATDYMLIFDSDDTLDPRCIEVLEQNIVIIDNDKYVSGIIGNKLDVSTKSTLINKLPSNINYATGIELYQKFKVTGDVLRMYKTGILKNYLFPQIEGEKFIYENVVFDAIDDKYSMLIIHETLYYYEYQNDGYTVNSHSIKLKNPKGYALSLNSSVSHSIKLKKAISWSLLYIIWCRQMNIKNSYGMFTRKKLYITLQPVALMLTILKRPKFFFNIFNAT